MLSATLLLTFGALFVHAFDSIDTASTATAGSDFQVTITNDLSTSNSFDAGFDQFVPYLAITVPGWGTMPSCFLTKPNPSINTTSLTVTIPASVGESGHFYSISTVEINPDPNKDGPSGYEYSAGFTLSGANGQWSEYELSGHVIGDPDSIPCSAYDCARQCSQKFYPDNTGNSSASDAAYNKTLDCIDACPGVIPQSRYTANSGDEGSNSSSVAPSATSSGSTASSPTASSVSNSATATSSASAGSTSVSGGSRSPTEAVVSSTANSLSTTMTKTTAASLTQSQQSSTSGTAAAATTTPNVAPRNLGLSWFQAGSLVMLLGAAAI